jgi:predicted N-formylglutamate amidohydrolase
MLELPPFVITCEHASCDVPPDGPELGVPREALLTHASWDPGALQVATAMAMALGAPLAQGRYTRLLVDLNRSRTNLREVVPSTCYGLQVPGNQGLTDAGREQRLRAYYDPYRREVEEHVLRAQATWGVCLALSIHSFTPELDPLGRSFQVGLLFDPARAAESVVATELAQRLRERGLTVAFNQPYAGTDDGIHRPFRTRWSDARLVAVEVELNQGMMQGGWSGPVVEALMDGALAFAQRVRPSASRVAAQ